MTDKRRMSQAVHVEGAPGVSPVLFLCEHASNHFPGEFGDLGLSDDVRQSHVTWDPHALTIARRLAGGFNAPLVSGGASRLIYDCNRPPEAPDAVPEQSEIYAIPGNQALSEAAREARVEGIYRPFCQAVDDTIAASAPQVIVTIHTFTPVYFNRPRSVEIGILHDSDSRLADAMLARGVGGYDTRRNDPYGPEHGVTHSLRLHAIARGLLNVMIEVRNDLTPDEDRMTRLCRALSRSLGGALADMGITTRGAA